MYRFIFTYRVVNGFYQCRIVLKLAVCNGFGYFGKVLIHHAACAEVNMTYFRVTHLTLG